MRHHAQKLVLAVGLLLGGLFLVFVFNQTMQLVQAAERVSPLFGAVVLWALLGLFAFGIVVFLWNFVRLPKPLRVPATDVGPRFDTFLRRLRKRLQDNPVLGDCPLVARDDIEAALVRLGETADDKTRAAALQAFFVTAISQNGNLDALAVMAIHARLVYDVARLYYQRPTARDLLYLYGNVVVSALVARQLDDWDMSEYVTPIINASMGSAVGVVPGATAAASAAVQAVLTGSANAYMTLRVGVIAKRFCSSVTRPDRKQLRDAAFVEALKMFPGVVGDGTKRVFQIIGNAAVQGTKGAVTTVAASTGKALRTAGEATRSAATTVRHWVAGRAGSVADGVDEAAAGTEE